MCIQAQAEGGQGQPLEAAEGHRPCAGEDDEEEIQRVESFCTNPVETDEETDLTRSYATVVPTKESFGTIVPDRHSFNTLLPDSPSFQTVPRMDSFSAYSHASHETHRTLVPHSKSFNTIVGAGSRCASFHADQPDPPRMGLPHKVADPSLYKDSLEATALPHSPQGPRVHEQRTWRSSARVAPTR